MDPKRHSLWMDLGDAYYWSVTQRSEAPEAYRKSIDLCEQTLKVNPKDATALHDLAMSHAMLSHRREALQSIQAATQVAPADPVNMYYAALVHAQFGEARAAMQWVKKALNAGTTIAQVRDSPNLQFLAKDADFQKFLKTKEQVSHSATH
jgi:tetratricopeptide (TPR) repeat protein